MIITLASSLLSGGVFAQTQFQQNLINDINALTEQINIGPETKELYVKRSEAIFILNATEPEQTWVPFTLVDAINDVNCALDLHPDDASLYSLRAEYKRDIYRDREGAVSDMNRAIELDPDNAQWYLQRANYQNLSNGCFDYILCAAMKDKRCQEIVLAVCSDMSGREF